MPIKKKLMESLQKQYGKEKGERVYYAMEQIGRPPFGKGWRGDSKRHSLARRKR